MKYFYYFNFLFYLFYNFSKLLSRFELIFFKFNIFREQKILIILYFKINNDCIVERK